jgi:succinate dehydrogenase/fumarate reductase flavoprotein subunit
VEGFCAYAIPFATTSGARSGISASAYINDVDNLSLERDEIQCLREELSGPLKRTHGVEPDYVVLKVQEILFPRLVYLFRHQERLQQALDRISHLRLEFVPMLQAYDPHYLRMAIEADNMALCGELFLRAALSRRESRGSHLREDYPEVDNINGLKWVILKEKNGTIEVSTEDIPMNTYPMGPERKKTIHPIAEIMKW